MQFRVEDNPLTGLSDRERLVAAKFAEGMTYREISETLFIAPTTVRTHLSAIYRKLGVGSKMALAILLADHPPVEGNGPPVVAVIPFENLSGDERCTRLADGLSADMMADLARYRDLAVIARQTMLSYKGRHDDIRLIGRELNVDYLLEGTIQAAGVRLRISVQLVDARTGVDLWTARYDRLMEDLFEVQDTVTENVVNVLANCCGKFAKLRTDIVKRKPPANLHAYDYYLLGVEQHNLYTRASHEEAVRLLSRAVDLDKDLARGWTVLGMAYSVGAINAFTDDTSAAIERSILCLERALALDAGDTHARICLAGLRAAQGDLDATAREYDLALAFAPNDADTLALLAGEKTFVTGDPRDGYELARRAIRLNPHVSWYYSMLGRSTFVAGLYRECLAALAQAPPDSPATLLFLTMAHAMQGEMAQAARLATRLANKSPDFTVEGFIRAWPVINPPALVAIRDGARRAGLLGP
ncbi:LuxR C-terminal-related transcriptional regulator [Mesorhizobium amorphae]|uniref:LuxR C-terminal-related transcriptional regulator n=1 Tax=Mesorhizobium amorphae TaxID=71433 RepID=UPI001FEE78A2|nr:LuxR C-terminal-related transcriptional regulator [Mesorhizobium amorphae]